MAHVWVDGEEIICTPGHKFYAPEKGWTSAIDLKAGDILVLSNGEYVTVEKVQHELLEEPVKVYNFEVEDFHTYYVGTDVSVLVHNMCKKPGGYEVGDIDDYGNVKPKKNRAPGNTHSAADNYVEGHHPIQNEWAKRNVKDYDENDAPAILLESSSQKPHAKISSSQRIRRANEGYDTDIKYEFNVSYREMIDANVSEKTAKRAIKKAYKYVDSIGAFDDDKKNK